MKKILVLEDEASIRSFIVINLRRAGYDVIEAETGEEALERLRANPDTKVALLDIMLPGIDGFEVCRRIRATNTKIGIIMLTARSQEMDKVTGLMTGADDYVTKPFRLAELLARVRALLRRQVAEPAEGVLRAQDIRMDVAAHRAFVGDVELSLTAKEFDLLRVLLREAGSVVARDALMREVWGSDPTGSTKTLDMHVSWLRRKLGDDATNPHYITTVRGMGFRFESAR